MILEIFGILFGIAILGSAIGLTYYFNKYPIKEFGNDYISLGLTYVIAFLLVVISILIFYYSSKKLSSE